MTLWWEVDPADAVVVDGRAVEATSGDVTLQPSFSTGLLVETVAGFPGLILDGQNLRTTTSLACPSSGAVVARVRIPAAALEASSPSMGILGWQPNFSSGLSLQLDTDAVPVMAGYKGAGDVWTNTTTPAPDDGAFHVWVLAWDPVQVELWCDGELLDTAESPADTTGLTGAYTVGGSPSMPSTPGVLHYLAYYDGVVDPAALTTEVQARFVATEVTGSATITVGASLVLAGRVDTPDAPAPDGDGGQVTPPNVPDPVDPPAGVPAAVVRRVSEIMPAPTLENGWPVDWEPTETIREEVGSFQVVVEGTDITYLHGAPVPTPEWSGADPFGSSLARVRLPQVTAFHTPGEGSMSWCRGGANVTILLAGERVFDGVLVSFGHDEAGTQGEFTLTVLGALYQADLQLRKPSFSLTPTDMGAAIAGELTDVISRRYAAIPTITLGIPTGMKGGWEPKLTGRVQQLLATAITGGRQWTVACVDREPVLVQRDTTTVHWHVANGARGVGVHLSRDWTQAPNAYYGEGIAPDGGRWRNSKYPNWRPDDTPPYPFTNPAQLIGVGTTDGATDTGNGVSLWQARVGRPVTGVFSSGDRARLRELQAAAGIQVDGSLGPQSWAATFATGSNTGTLDGAWIAPLSEDPKVRPRLYAVDGADLGPNPDYDPTILRVERYVNFGEGVSKDEGVRAAAEMRARDQNPGWVGTITLTVDPEEGSRFFIREGQNVAIRYWRGNTTLLVHVAAVDQSEDSTTLTVDTNARDFPTLDAIRNREREAVDPARAYISPRGRSRVPQDTPTFDAEAGGGLVPRHALFANLWTVIRIPVAAYGRIVRTDFTTSGQTPFSLALFDRPVTAAQLLAWVGNPLAVSQNPWSDEELDERGLLMAWGWAKQPAGYWPGSYSTPDGDDQSPPTGRLVDDASVEYASTRPPWLWVAEIAESACYIQGRFFPGTD